MAVSSKFLEAVSADAALGAEVNAAVLEVLGGFLKEKGLEEEAWNFMEPAVEKIAKAHGFEAEEKEGLDLDELDAVAGGGTCACPIVGGGPKEVDENGNGDGPCACPVVGAGSYYENWKTKDGPGRCGCGGAGVGDSTMCGYEG